MNTRTEFPENWRSISFPYKRAELLEYLREIAATSANSLPSFEEFDIDEIVHFLFDDTDLGDPSRSTVGQILFDDKEQSMVRELVVLLDQVFKELGNASSRAFLAHRLGLVFAQRLQTF